MNKAQILKFILLTEDNKNENYIQFYNRKYKDLINFDNYLQIVQNDPTSNIDIANKKGKAGKYSTWLLKLFIDKKLKTEDLYKAKEYLSLYDRHKKKIPIEKRDIFKIENLVDLFSIIEDFKKQVEFNQIPTQEELNS